MTTNRTTQYETAHHSIDRQYCKAVGRILNLSTDRKHLQYSWLNGITGVLRHAVNVNWLNDDDIDHQTSC